MARPAGSSRSGAGVFIALDKLDKIGRDGVPPSCGRPGHPAGARRPHAGALLASSATPAALRALLGARRGRRRVAACRGSSTRSRRRRRRPVPARVRRDARARDGLLHRADLRDPVGELASSIAGGGRYDRMVGHARAGRPRHRLLDRLRARRGHPGRPRPRPARETGGSLLLFDEAAQDSGRGAAGGRRSGVRALVALERRAEPGAQRAALEEQGYEGSRVSPRGQLSVGDSPARAAQDGREPRMRESWGDAADPLVRRAPRGRRGPDGHPDGMGVPAPRSWRAHLRGPPGPRRADAARLQPGAVDPAAHEAAGRIRVEFVLAVEGRSSAGRRGRRTPISPRARSRYRSGGSAS